MPRPTLADITARLEAKHDSDDQALLDTLVALAARVERATAEHMYRFSATQAYADPRARSASPSCASGRSRARRRSASSCSGGCRRRSPPWPPPSSGCASLSQRIERAGALLRTRVDIATEAQNQQLLEKLTRGQELQLRLQSTVEGLSIAAISYYVVSLLLYAGQGGQGGRAAGAAGDGRRRVDPARACWAWPG